MICGGNRLATDFGYDIPGDNTGECWGISAHPNGDDSIANDCYAGMTLSQLWDEHPELFGNIEGDRFPLLIKIIDAKDNLSIQVHPYDEYAAKNEAEKTNTYGANGRYTQAYNSGYNYNMFL